MAFYATWEVEKEEYQLEQLGNIRKTLLTFQNTLNNSLRSKRPE